MELITVATETGARLREACKAMEISTSSFERWRAGNLIDSRKGSVKNIPQKLTYEEEQELINLCCNKQYKDLNPYKIHASLLDKGVYIASISSFYRVLRKNSLITHRGNSRPSKKRNPPLERKATGPNQVWTWDITFLKTDISGLFYYAYVIIDIWNRSIVKWAIHDREHDTLAQELFQCALLENQHPDVFVHSDNGNPMKGVSFIKDCSILAISSGLISLISLSNFFLIVFISEPSLRFFTISRNLASFSLLFPIPSPICKLLWIIVFYYKLISNSRITRNK
ncbi:transposase [Thiospirochaeta perfilievii]|uniref:Transposase n=1 Tax=Thiospirochaeta perfilievii TaxID=252967 RepID=A0A5C1QFD4_9SPIO|nr:DDE-type integrase/transposase/recombinase [Thiospirochaeta perfilievii]QEN05344.1 transposase [Thiospirochaeta perfilievii]